MIDYSGRHEKGHLGRYRAGVAWRVDWNASALAIARRQGHDRGRRVRHDGPDLGLSAGCGLYELCREQRPVGSR